MTTLVANNIVKKSAEEYAELILKITNFARLASLSWSDDLDGFKPFRDNDILVLGFYDLDNVVKNVFVKCGKSEKEYYKINDKFNWMKELIKETVFISNFSIDLTMLEKIINSGIPREYIA